LARVAPDRRKEAGEPAAAEGTPSGPGGGAASTADNVPAAAAPEQAPRGPVAGRHSPTTDRPGSNLRRTGRPRWSNRLRIAVVGTLGLLLVLGALLYAFVLNRPQIASTKHEAAPEPTVPTEPLRVRALEVVHFASVDGKPGLEGRVLGTDSFGAKQDDDITVKARLSRPAYCYLILFRPDG